MSCRSDVVVSDLAVALVALLEARWVRRRSDFGVAIRGVASLDGGRRHWIRQSPDCIGDIRLRAPTCKLARDFERHGVTFADPEAPPESGVSAPPRLRVVA